MTRLVAIPVRWFQINRHDNSPTAPTEFGESTGLELGEKRSINILSRPLWTVTEVAFIAICFGMFAGQIPPDVNESHYLTKAKHFWNPNWCPDDIFLGSSFSHLLFYASTGWLTRFCSLSVFAWIGRIATWVLLAFAWQRLSFRVVPRPAIALVSAVFFLILNDEFHMSGEWVVGGFEAKGFAFVFVLLALERMVSGHWKSVWILLGFASAFHVLVGGWATLAALTSWTACSLWRQRPDIRLAEIKSNGLPLAIGLAIALVGIVPPLITEIQTPRELSQIANRIYVENRIAHHLHFGSFQTIFVARFALITLVWLALFRHFKSIRQLQSINYFCLASLVFVFLGLMLSGLEEQNDRAGDLSRTLLKFYWFRLADFAVPMAFSLSCTLIVSRWLRGSHGYAQRICGWLFVSAILTAMGIHIFEKNIDPRPVAVQRSLPAYDSDPVRTVETYQNWRKVCAWIADNTASDSKFITPLEQQTFKWYAGRTEIVSWKDIPQDARAMVEWNRRIIDLCEPQRRYNAGLMAFSDDQLIALARKYGADYLLIPQNQVESAEPPTQLKRVYPPDSTSRTTYTVYEFE